MEMWTRSKSLVGIYLAFLAAGLSLFLLLLLKINRLSVLNHRFPFDPFLFPLLFLISFLFFLSLWIGLAGLLRRSPFSPGSATILFPIFLPWSFFLFSPFLLCFYWSREDLLERLTLLATFILLASFILGLITWERTSGGLSRFLRRLVENFSRLPLGRKLVILFLIAFILYQAVTLALVLQGITFSGDEPNYLLTTHSLLYDRDINLANNYARQDYFAFYSRKEHPRLKLGIYGRYGRKGKDYIYPINLPGISVLILPFYGLGQLFSGKLLTFILKGSLSLWAVLFGLQVYLYGRQRWRREGLALALWFLTSFTTPVLFYATHLYPEIPIAFFSLLIFRRVFASHPISWPEGLGLGFLLAAFPWFGLKYNFMFWPLLLIGVYRLLRHWKLKSTVLAFLIFPLLSQLLFYLFIYHLYGTFSPIAIYEGVMTSEQMRAFRDMVLEIPFLLRLETFLDYFLDQRDGLLLYSPLYLFALLGFIDMARRTKGKFFAVLLVSLPFLFNYAFFTHRQGYSPQARVLTPIIWVGVCGLGAFLSQNQKRALLHLFGLGAGASLLIAGLLVSHPSFLYQPTTHEFTSRPGDLFVHLSNTHFFLPALLPSFIKIRNIDYLPNYIWTGLLLALLLVYAFGGRAKLGKWGLGRGSILAFLLLAFFLWVIFPRPPLYPVKTITYSPQRSLGFYLFSLGKGVVVKDQGDFYLHLEKPYRFVFGARQELEKIQVILGSDTGHYRVWLRAFDLPLLETEISREKQRLELTLPPPYRWRHIALYEITLEMKHLSSEPMLLEPFLLQIIPGKR